MEKTTSIQSVNDLIVYRRSYDLAISIFELTSAFPKHEEFSLTSQIRRASRSVAANICEGWAKRKYENLFKRHLNDSSGSCEEVKMWLNFAKDFQYIKTNTYEQLLSGYEEVGAMLNVLARNWRTY